jgi:hypothetical protein
MYKRIFISLCLICFGMVFIPEIPITIRTWLAGFSVLFLSVFIILDDN